MTLKTILPDEIVEPRASKEKIIKELQILEDRDGLIYPEAVVEFAKKKSTELHKVFEWDDNIASEKYRLWQARQVIRACVTTLVSEEVSTKAFVNIIDASGDRGYVRIAHVLSNEQNTAYMLSVALRELSVFRKKYKDLKELVKVFDAIDKLI